MGAAQQYEDEEYKKREGTCCFRHFETDLRSLEDGGGCIRGKGKEGRLYTYYAEARRYLRVVVTAEALATTMGCFGPGTSSFAHNGVRIESVEKLQQLWQRMILVAPARPITPRDGKIGGICGGAHTPGARC